MDIENLKQEYIGKKLLSIIDINLDDAQVVSALRKITNNDYSERIDDDEDLK